MLCAACPSFRCASSILATRQGTADLQVKRGLCKRKCNAVIRCYAGLVQSQDAAARAAAAARILQLKTPCEHVFSMANYRSQKLQRQVSTVLQTSAMLFRAQAAGGSKTNKPKPPSYTARDTSSEISILKS